MTTTDEMTPRERSLMVTKLEEARMWAGEGMMRE